MKWTMAYLKELLDKTVIRNWCLYFLVFNKHFHFSNVYWLSRNYQFQGKLESFFPPLSSQFSIASFSLEHQRQIVSLYIINKKIKKKKIASYLLVLAFVFGVICHFDYLWIIIYKDRSNAHIITLVSCKPIKHNIVKYFPKT